MEEDVPWQLLLEGTLHLILDQHIVSPCPHQALVLPGMEMNNKSVYTLNLESTKYIRLPCLVITYTEQFKNFTGVQKEQIKVIQICAELPTHTQNKYFCRTTEACMIATSARKHK